MDKSLKVGEYEWRERERKSTKFCASKEVDVQVKEAEKVGEQ